MQTLSSPIETVLSNKITRNIIVQSFKGSPRKPLRRRPIRGLPYMTSSKFSDILTPSPPVTVTNQLFLFLSPSFWGPPIHCGRHIWKPPYADWRLHTAIEFVHLPASDEIAPNFWASPLQPWLARGHQMPSSQSASISQINSEAQTNIQIHCSMICI